MKKFFHAHPDIVITALAAIFIGALIAFYSWAINDIYADVHLSLTSSAPGGADSFNMEEASKLDLRGLGVGVPPAPVGAPAPAAASTTSGFAK